MLSYSDNSTTFYVSNNDNKVLGNSLELQKL